MRVLIIDDDTKLTSFIKRGLQADRFAVDVVETGQRGFEYSEVYGYDLILLDTNVVDMKSCDVLVRIRRTNLAVPS